ncbi:MAG: hypothetical protein ACLU9T_17120 [Blautia faecis]
MEYLKIEGEFPKLTNCAVTMGKFDGIHRGHRKLVEKIRERKTLGEQAVLFAIDASSNMILTSQERASLLEKLGVDVLVECQLNDRIRHMKAENFIKEILMGDLGASYVVVGEDNRLASSGKVRPGFLWNLEKSMALMWKSFPKKWMDTGRSAVPISEKN